MKTNENPAQSGTFFSGNRLRVGPLLPEDGIRAEEGDGLVITLELTDEGLDGLTLRSILRQVEDPVEGLIGVTAPVREQVRRKQEMFATLARWGARLGAGEGTEQIVVDGRTVPPDGLVVRVALVLESLDPIPAACAGTYDADLDEDGQMDFKGKARAFVRSHGLLAPILPYSDSA